MVEKFRRVAGPMATACALAAAALWLIPAGALAEGGRAMVWRGECCEEVTERGGRDTCKAIHVSNSCCVSKSEMCRTGCGIDHDNDGMREACEDLCQSDGLACMDEGPIVSQEDADADGE